MKKFLVVIGLILVLFGGLHAAYAVSASVYFSPPEPAPAVGGEFAVRVLIDSDQPVNAYAVSLSYDPGKLEFLGSDNSRSIIDVAQRLPDASIPGSISFKGGSVAQFKGTAGELLTLRFRARASGATELHFADAELYLANGKGTKIIPSTLSAELFISNQSSAIGPGQIAGSRDITPPEISFLAFVKDPLNPDQKFLSFSVRDPGSGVRSVSYRARSFIFSSVPADAINPIALPNGVWSASIEVIDNAGNKTEKTIYDWSALFEAPFLVLAMFSLIVVAIFVHLMKRGKKGILK